jgi:hypothetical protein
VRVLGNVFGGSYRYGHRSLDGDVEWSGNVDAAGNPVGGE